MVGGGSGEEHDHIPLEDGYVQDAQQAVLPYVTLHDRSYLGTLSLSAGNSGVQRKYAGIGPLAASCRILLE